MVSCKKASVEKKHQQKQWEKTRLHHIQHHLSMSQRWSARISPSYQHWPMIHILNTFRRTWKWITLVIIYFFNTHIYSDLHCVSLPCLTLRYLALFHCIAIRFRCIPIYTCIVFQQKKEVHNSSLPLARGQDDKRLQYI